MRKVISIICLTLLCLTAHANQKIKHWEYSLSPYLWFINLNGTAGADGVNVSVNQSFTDLWSDLNFAGMLFFDAHYDRLGIFLDVVYTKVSNSEHIDGEKAKITNIFGVFTPGLSYQVVRQQVSDQAHFIFEPYAGIRITRNDANVKFGSIDSDNNVYWSDALIGTRLIFEFYKQWTLSLTGDFGGTTSPDQRSYNAVALLGYQFPNVVFPLSIFGGYRYLHQTYITSSETDSFDWDMGVFGPLIGIKGEF